MENRFIIPTLTLILCNHVYNQNLKHKEYCLNQLNLQYCSVTSDTKNVLWNLYSVLDNHFTVLTLVPCVGLGYDFKWTLKTFGSEKIYKEFETYKNRSILFIEANSLPAGEYVLELTISHHHILKTRNFRCFVRLQTVPVIAAIDGATFKNVHDGNTIQLDGSHSFTGGNVGVKYKWKANREGAPQGSEKGPSTLEADGKVASFVFRGDIGQTWKISLTVIGGKYRNTIEHSIEVQAATKPLLDIACRQNCPATESYQLVPTITLNLEAVCYKNCDIIAIFNWKVLNAQPIGDMTFGVKDSRFSTRFPSFDQQTTIQIEVHALDGHGRLLAKAMLSLPGFVRATGSAKCLPIEETVMELLSVIRPQCEATANIVTYKILQYIDADEVEIILAKNVAPDFAVRLTYNTEMYAQFIVENVHMVVLDVAPVEIDVSDTIPSNYSSTKEIAKEMYSTHVLSPTFCQNPTRLGTEGRVWEAVQVINALMPKLYKEENDHSTKQYSIDLSTRVLQDILTFPTEGTLESLITVLLRLMRPEDEPKVRKYALALSYTCRHLAEERKALLKTKNALLYENVARTEYKILRKCANYLMTSNYQKHEVNKITTPPPLPNHPTIDEDYPYYGDIVTNTMREDYVKITNNTIEIAKLATFNWILTWAYGELEFAHEIDYFHPDRTDMIKRNVKLERCEINLPQNIGFDDNEYLRLIANTFNESLLFWESSTTTVNTVLVNLRFVDKKGNEIYKIPELADVLLSTSGAPAASYKEESASLPPGHLSFNDTNIAVFRINMGNASKISVSLNKITGPVKVAVLQGKRPLLSDFETSVVVTKIDYDIHVESIHYDNFLYISVVPMDAFKTMGMSCNGNVSCPYTRKSRQIINEQVTFRISAISQECVEWRDNHWFPSDCRIGNKTTKSTVHCQCYSISNVAGFTDVPNLTRRDILVTSITLRFSQNYAALIMVTLVIFCYCVAIIFAIFRRASKQQIYYLADNLSTHNYAYLVSVKTNTKINSGTTANVVIKVFGKYSQSRPHVLNYPDPDKNLLLCGSEDYFVLTTRHHLGDLTSIELWTDCLYIRPIWRCDYVKICDLQTRTWYTFEVNKLFSPLKGHNHFASIKVKDPLTKRRKELTYKRLRMIFNWRFGAEHTWNIFSNKNDDSFGYIERITILLLNITTVYSVAMLICVRPRFEASDSIYDKEVINAFRVGLYTFLTCLVTFPMSMVFVFIFRNLTRKATNKYAFEKKRFPEKIKFVNWSLVCLIIIVSTLYVIFAGGGIATSAIDIWLIVTTASLILNIFVWENLYLCITDVIRLVRKPKIVYEYDNIVKESQNQKVHLKEVVPRRYSLRPYLLHLYQPTDGKRLRRKRAEIVHRHKISSTFKHFIAFLIYFMLLYILVAVNLDKHIIILNNHMRDMMEGQLDGIELEQVKSIEQMMEYLNETFILTLHTFNWYGNYSVYDPGLMVDFQTKFLGVARVRQKRVITLACPRYNLITDMFEIGMCIPPYSPDYENTTSLTEIDSLWRYQNISETGGLLIPGEFALYGGGGYIGYTGRTLQNAYYSIEEMSEENWFDKYTSAVFIEFWAYNANTDLFSIVAIAFEFKPDGYTEKSYKIYTTHLLHASVRSELIILVVFSLYCFFIFYQIGYLILKIIEERMVFLRRGVNYLEMVIVAGNLTVICTYMHRQIVVERLLDDLSIKKNNEFTQYFLAEYYTEFLTLMIAILMCISVMRTWRFLRFGFMFKVFERAFRTQVAPLCSALAFSLTIYAQYIVISYLLFGSYVRIFRNIGSTITVINLLSMEQYHGYNHDEVGNLLPVMSKLFFVAYRISLLTLVNVFIAIITLHYEDSKSYMENQEPEFSIFSYFIEECKYIFAYIKRKRKYIAAGGDPIDSESYSNTFDDEPPKITKKFNDEDQASGIVYVPSSKLDFISLIIITIYYNETCREDTTVLTNEDYELMRNIVWYYEHQNQGVPIGFHQFKTEEGKSHYMLQRDLHEMEMVVNYLLQPEPKAEKKSSKKPAKALSDRISLKRLCVIARSLKYVNNVIQNINVIRRTSYEQRIK